MYPGKNIQQLVTLHTHASLPMEIHITTYYVVIPRTRKQNLIKSLALTVNVQEVGGTRRQICLKTPQEIQLRKFILLENLQGKQFHVFNKKLKEKSQQ